MSATGIGAAVRRKEDHRFITGKGHYTDDINRPGQTYAFFVRSPHAHATIKSIDSKAAAAMPGVVAVLTGAELAADKIGNLICGWMIHSKDGSPMKMAPHPALAARQSLPRRRSGRGGHRRNVGASARRRRKAQDRLRRAAGGRRSWPRRRSRAPPQIHEVAPHNTIYQWHHRRSERRRRPHSNRPSTSPSSTSSTIGWCRTPMEPRAALAEYDAGSDQLTLWNTSQNPHVARLVIAAFVGMAPEHKLRVIAPDVGGGFGSKIFHLSRRSRGVMGRPGASAGR